MDGLSWLEARVRAFAALMVALAISAPGIARASGMIASSTSDDAALCPMNELSVDVELSDEGATLRERRTYPFAPLADDAAPRLVRFYKSLSSQDAEVLAVTVDGAPHGGTLLDVPHADVLRQTLVLELGDPAPLREMGTPMWVMDPIGVSAEQTEVVIDIEWSTGLHRQGTLDGLSLPIDWHSRPVNDVTVDVVASTGMPLRALYSPYHDLEVERVEEHRATGTYSGRAVPTAFDLTLLLSSGNESVRLDLMPFRYGDAEGGFFLALLSTELAPPETQVIPRDLVVALDVSGSMEGEKIVQAKEALQGVLEGLRPEDRFTIVAFEGQIASFRPRVVDATSANVASASRFVDELFADGSTNIDAALAESFSSLPSSRDRSQSVVLITDGEPTEGETDVEAIVANAKRINENRARIYTFGIGHDVNTVLLDRLAEVSSGDALYIEPGESVLTTVETFFSRIQTPVVANPSLDFGNFQVEEAYPEALQDLFAGSTVVLAGRYGRPGQGTIELRGSLGGQPTKLPFDVTLPEFDQSNAFAPAVWATRHIGNLLENVKLGDDDPQLVEDALAAATRWGVVSRFTFFDVDTDGDTRMAYGEVSQSAVGAEAVGTSSALDEQTKEETVRTFASADVRATLDRSLPLQQGYFTDSSLRSDDWVEVHFASSLYFELARQEAQYGAARLLSVGPNVRFELLGRVFRVTDPDAVDGLPPEADSIPEPAYHPTTTSVDVRAEEPQPYEPGGGCACRVGSTPSGSSGGWALLAAGLLLLRRPRGRWSRRGRSPNALS